MCIRDRITSGANVVVKSKAQTALDKVDQIFSRRNSAHGSFMHEEIERFNERAAKSVDAVTHEQAVPPGSPIGTGIYETCWHCEELD